MSEYYVNHNNQIVRKTKKVSFDQISLHHINYNNEITTVTKINNKTDFSKEELDVIWELWKQIKSEKELENL